MPMLKATDFVKCIDRYEFWDKLFGTSSLADAEAICSDFWARWKQLYPDYDLFGRSLPLNRCCPIYVHGDEGQHYKKGAVMICQWQSAIGTGTGLNNDNMFGNLSQKKYYVNQKRVTLSTRFLFGVMPKDTCHHIDQYCYSPRIYKTTSLISPLRARLIRVEPRTCTERTTRLWKSSSIASAWTCKRRIWKALC